MGAPLLERVAEGILICDGGMGTMLQAAGLPSGHPGELWNIEEPEKVTGIHRAYLEAGANIVLTNTFGGSQLRLAESGIGERVSEINKAAARNARAAADSFGAFVFGDIGPSGQLMEPYGEVSEEDMYESFLAQAKALAQGGADALIVETMTALSEMLVAIRAARDVAPGLPIVASFSFKQAAGEYRTMMGETIDHCAREAVEAGASIVGTNCGMGIDEMIEVIRLMRNAVTVPLIAQPNAGLPELVNGRMVYRQTPAMMAEKVPALIAAGARIVGGCCGTNPDYIRLLSLRAGA